MDREPAVRGHYGVSGLEAAVLDVVRQAGKDPERLTVTDLYPIDEFHMGGIGATRDLAAAVGVRAGWRLLDIGSGLGGPARCFAAEFGCRVNGIDLTPEFVEAAEGLTRRAGLDDAAEFRVASALDLPFEAATFDAATLIHVGMNISDKAGAFREARRVLKPGGVFGVFDILRTAEGEIHYPVPWATTADTSFVATAAEYRAALEGAGFRIITERNRADVAVAPDRRQPSPGLVILNGDRAPLLLQNLKEASDRGILAPVEILARAA